MSILPERPRVGLGVVIIRHKQVLIGRRLGAHGENTWSIPGGHVEFGESWEQCAKRETKEETGLNIEHISFLGVTDDFDIGEGKHYVTIFVKASVLGGEPQICEPDKYVDLHWCAWEEIPAPRFSPLAKLIRQGIHPFATHDHKLVRDRIPEIIQNHGDIAVIHQASAEEYKHALQAKLIEEVEEYLQSEKLEEIADILEVIHSLTALHGIHREHIQNIQTKKRDERGGFDEGIILDETR